MSSDQESKKVPLSSQEAIKDFWNRHVVPNPTPTLKTFPSELFRGLLPYHLSAEEAGASSSRNAATNYDTAAQHCRDRVARIVKACRRTNTKFIDEEFNIYDEFIHQERNFLTGLIEKKAEKKNGVEKHDDSEQASADEKEPPKPFPKSCKRVDKIFENPVFVKDGFTKSEISQGRIGNCWFVGGLIAMATVDGLIDRVCVARDEKVGVYGFVFHRDGNWVPVVVDDFLYLINEDWCGNIDPDGSRAKEYRQIYQMGSKNLWFGKCKDQNETWFPLLEKAFAKLHGDYPALIAGWCGEAIEDMTAGVSTQLLTNSIFDKEQLWADLIEEPRQHLFSASTLTYSHKDYNKQGLAALHSYIIIQAAEERGQDGKTVHLVKLRNPWGHASMLFGHGDWTGPWGKGSKEWTPYWLQKLNYSFADDGVFWISFEDLLEHFGHIGPTKLFDNSWTIAQEWSSFVAPWVDGFSNKKFIIDVKQAGPSVIVLTQIDDTCFKGLQGPYSCKMSYVLRKEGEKDGDYIARVPAFSWYWRSISLEVDLEPGRYEVLTMIRASIIDGRPAKDVVVKEYAKSKPMKLKQIGMSHDWAFAKAQTSEHDSILNAQRQGASLNLADKEESDTETSPWSAVCVCGLRVYTKDPQTLVSLVAVDGMK